MKKNQTLSAKNIWAFFLFGLAVSCGAALLQHAPGYMDAEYYFAGGVRLAQGHGFTQNFLWNYLDQPSGLPHPSHTYWMPLPSLVAALGMMVVNSQTYLAGKTIFVILAALLSPLTAVTAWSLSHHRTTAVLAGFFALFPGFYLAYTTATETVTLYMILGTLFFLITSKPDLSERDHFLTGLIAGALHMTRADGLLWGAAAGGWIIYLWLRQKPFERSISKLLISLLVFMAGYLALSGFWYWRNLQIFGSPFPPGGNLTLWLTEYNQTFLPAGTQLTFSNWLESGISSIIKVRLDALWVNLQTFAAVQGGIFLLPFIVAGLWQLRKKRIIQLAVGLWFATLLVMSFAFPFAGMRGGFLHSGAAFQPLFWAGAVIGLKCAVDWGVKHRNWHPTRAFQNFGMLLVFCSAVMTVFLFTSSVIGSDPRQPIIQKNQLDFEQIHQFLKNQGLSTGVIMINDPPGFSVTTGVSSIVIPFGDLNEIVMVGEKFDADYLVIQTNHVPALSNLYVAPVSVKGLRYIGKAADAQIYGFEGGGNGH